MSLSSSGYVVQHELGRGGQGAVQGHSETRCEGEKLIL